MKAFLHLDQFEERAGLYTWLCEIGKNKWLAECRRQGRYTGKEDEWETAGLYSLEQDVIRRQMVQKMRREIADLPEPYRDVVVLRTYGELPFKEIARQYQVSPYLLRIRFYL